MRPFIRKFKAELKVKMPNVTSVQLVRATEERFGRWIRDYVLNPLNSNMVNDEEEELEYENGSDEDNELGEEDRRIVLTIQGGSFNPSNNMTCTISSIWKSRFTRAWDNWTIVPTEDKEIWFNSFKEKYTWDAKINTKA
nr:hypothetical protein [Tanacetum cinerariifolium]